MAHAVKKAYLALLVSSFCAQARVDPRGPSIHMPLAARVCNGIIRSSYQMVAVVILSGCRNPLRCGRICKVQVIRL